MNKKLSFLSVFEVNPLVLFSVFFTISIIIAAVASTIIEIQEPFFRVILGLAISCAAPVLALIALNTKSISKRIDDMESGLIIGLLFHFTTTIGIVTLAVIVLWLLFPLPDDLSLGITVWRDIRFIIQSYIVILLGAKIIDIRKTASTNRYLKIIQASKSISKKTGE